MNLFSWLVSQENVYINVEIARIMEKQLNYSQLVEILYHLKMQIIERMNNILHQKNL